MKAEFLRINHIDVGFASFSTEGTIYSDPKALSSEVTVRKGKLHINLLSPSLMIDEKFHNGYLPASEQVDWIRFATYHDLSIPDGNYDTEIQCPYGDGPGFEVWNFPWNVKFHGTITLQKGFIYLEGDLRPVYGDEDWSIPLEIGKNFDPQPLIPERESLTLPEARQKNPLEVFEIKIDQGVFDAFPEEVLSYKNLESLWIGAQAQLNCEELPAAFYELIRLHSIQLYGGFNRSGLRQLSPEIRQLRQLEELTINGTRLEAIPEEMGALYKLREINLKSNQLHSLPESIGHLPQLQLLDIRSNEFSSLPASLNRIPRVNIDRKYKKLYTDTRYKSRNSQPVDESLFDLSHYGKQREELTKEIKADENLRPYQGFLLDVARMGTYLTYDKSGNEIPPGTSKVGGAPDLPADWEHPKNNKGLHYLFHAQINCEEAAPYQHYLPRTGMLYFFVSDEEYVDTALVLYAGEKELRQLKRHEYNETTEFTDTDFNGNYREAAAVKFANAISLPSTYNLYHHGDERFPRHAEYLENLKKDDKRYDHFENHVSDFAQQWLETHEPVGHKGPFANFRTHSMNSFVFTQHESPEEQAAERFGGEPSEWMVLLNMESIHQFSFWDAGTLTYCIHKKDLAIADFSRIHTSIESS